MIKALETLNEQERDILLQTHERHVKSMGIEKQKEFTLDNIVKIRRNFEEKCFEVYFKNGEWYHYTIDKKWY